MMNEEMAQRIDLYEALAQWLQTHLGFHWDHRDPNLASRIERLCQHIKQPSIAACTHFWRTAPPTQSIIEMVAKEFTIGESYFFRDGQFFDALRHKILPELIANAKDKHLSIWSVGCSRGEEIYSIAIVLRELLPDYDQWHIQLLGTDINPDVLATARAGVFKKWSLRQMPSLTQQRYFTENEQEYALAPFIRDSVQFQFHNLLSRLPPSNGAPSYDLILLRNVLIYLNKPSIQRAIEFLYHQLKYGGWLITTSAEFDPQYYQSTFGKLTQAHPWVKKHQGSPHTPVEKAQPNLIIEDSAPLEHTPIQNTMHKDTQAELEEEIKQFFTLAIKAQQQKDQDKAKKALRACLYLDEDFIAAHIALANLLNKEQQMQAAQRHLKHAKKLLDALDDHALLPHTNGMKAVDMRTWLNTIERSLVI